MSQIRATHPYAFLSGEWAELLTTAPSDERDCYVVRFPDGATDFWPVGDTDAGYEFSEAVRGGGQADTEGEL